MPDEELCGAYWSGEDYLPTCELPAGHEGDHQTTATWPQWTPRPPRDPSEPPSALDRALRSAWGATLAHSLSVTQVFPRARVVNRDPHEEGDSG